MSLFEVSLFGVLKKDRTSVSLLLPRKNKTVLRWQDVLIVITHSLVLSSGRTGEEGVADVGVVADGFCRAFSTGTSACNDSSKPERQIKSRGMYQ